jgi:hypothetical protein
VREWSAAAFLGYISTWSAARRAREAGKGALLTAFFQDLLALWGDPQPPRITAGRSPCAWEASNEARPTFFPGLVHSERLTVVERHTVPHVVPDWPGFVNMPPVRATAMMIGFVEQTCIQALWCRSASVCWISGYPAMTLWD